MELEALLQARIGELGFYSPYSFLREFSPVEQFQFFVKPSINKLLSLLNDSVKTIQVDGNEFVFLFERLSWDSSFFNRNCYKLFTVLYQPCPPAALIQAAHQFKIFLSLHGNTYCFIELPSEDVFLLQCLTAAGIQLVETRLHYHRQDLVNFSNERFPVRVATASDGEALAQLAAQQRNPFDRTHADIHFTTKEADAYLVRYAQEALNGFCAGVLVPRGSAQPVNAFLAYSIFQETLPAKPMKRFHVALAAVSPSYQGGLYKLLSELVYKAKAEEALCVTYTTQTTNRAAIRTCEKLDFRFGRATHILSFSA
ncbi:hypothetical protein TH61_11380 [Rufibacter sp. DG15C]|uniref:GNAT family N-acetyltransferase n=1 Tax=Rufibacter sp. DG15C TaxID=1379909 RepID=UPI00078DCA8D|nr:N-acetyltransferase [Rufibacter sp. DG15C]AMM51657.1 hypothetical protein TH61_11380 [Rufibacter sp. DG15C]